MNAVNLLDAFSVKPLCSGTKIPITPTTCKEVMNAVEKLNTGKSADENGIQAKHFRNAKEELAPLLCEIINQIFQDLDIPDSMKSGILIIEEL
jgi:hypothetical protein